MIPGGVIAGNRQPSAQRPPVLVPIDVAAGTLAIIGAAWCNVGFAVTVFWDPRSESDLATAIDAGVLAETHYQDIKREVGSKPGERKELARDLAQFALDGGKLIIGIDEDKDARTWTLARKPSPG